MPLVHKPKAALIGLGAQLLLLPLIAWGLILGLQLNGALALGLILIAAAPGGPTSNLFTHLAGGDVALSVALTACISLLAPLWLPWVLGIQFNWLGLAASLHLPWLKSVMQLVLVTGMPLALGMLWQTKAPLTVQSLEKTLKRLATLVLAFMLVLLLINNNAQIGAALNPKTAALVMLLASLALAVGYLLAYVTRLNKAQAISLSFETGIQNAGIAMLVAFTQLHQPAAGLIALLYGLLMNVPALLLLAYFRYKPCIINKLR